MLFVSEGAAELTGYLPHEFTSQKVSFDQLILPEYRQYVWSEIQNNLNERKAYILEYKIRVKSGEIKWVWERGSGIFDDDGNLRFLEGFIADNTHQKEMENELNTLFEILPNLMSIATSEGKFLKINKAWSEKLGYSLDELSSMEIDKVIHPDDRDRTRNSWEYFVDGIMSGFRNRYITKSNNIIDLEWTSAYKDGKFYSVGRDITQNLKLENEIARNELLLKTLLNAITESSLLIELDGTVVIANEVAAKRVNKSLSDFIGKNVLLYLDDEVAKNRIARMDQVRRSKQPVVFEDQRFGRTILNSIYPVFDENGEVFRFAIFGYDITDKRNIERKAEYSSSLFSAVFDSSTDAIFLVQPDTNFIVTSNATARRLFDIPEGTDLSTTPGYTFHKNQFRPENLKLMYDSINKHGFWRDEIEYVSMNGREFWGEIAINPFNFHEEKYFLVRITDITERKDKLLKLESISEELRESNEQKDKFISILAHDLRGPFHPLLNSLELLDSEYDSLTEQEKKTFIKNSYETASNQFILLESILNWSRASQNKMRINFERFRMIELASTAIQQVSSISEEKKINIENNCHQNHEVIADYEMTLAIFRNLLTNAVKFSDIGGRIDISTTETEGMIITSVVDNGLGISKDRITNIFKIANAKSTRGTFNEKGSGLGLLICKELIEKMSGTINIESEELYGTKVSFSLPAAKN
jgi:PAS domain S-box-containing protein